MILLPRLQRYVWRELLGPTVLGLGLYTFVLLMNSLFLLARTALAQDFGWGWALQALALQLPRTLVLTIPMATLLGVLIGLGRLSGDHEWVALQGAGFGPRFLLRSVVLHGLVASALALGVYNLVFPRTNFAWRGLERQAMLGRNLTASLRPRVFLTDLPNFVLYVDELKAGSKGQMEGVWIYQNDPDTGREQMFVAKSGDLYPSQDRSGKIELDLRDGSFHSYRSTEPDSYELGTFGSYHLAIAPPTYLEGLRLPLEKSNLDRTPVELMAERRRAESQTDPILRHFATESVRSELHQRFALPLASVVFALLGIPLGVARVRSGKGAGFALSLLVITVYWVLFTTLVNQSRFGRVSPWVGVWTANVVMLLWGAWAYWRLRRRGAQEGRLLRALREFATFDWATRRARTSSVSESATALVAETPALQAELPASGHRWIGLIDRYIGVQYLRILLYSMLSAYVIYAVVELKNLSDDLVKNGQPVGVILSYFKYFAPGMLTFVLPVGCLVGALVAFALLTRTGELTALKAGGLSARRATLPVLVLTVVLCALSYHVQENITPTTNRKAQEVKDRIQGRMARTYGYAPGGRWTFGSEGRLYHYSYFDPRAASFQGLSVLSVDWASARILDHRFAQAATWNGREWDLHRGWYRRFPGAGAAEPPEFRRFERESVGLDPPDNFARREYLWSNTGELPEQMTLDDLGQQIRLLERSGYDTTKLRVAWHAKLAHPVTPLVMVMLGLPFAFRLGRRGSLYSIGVALIVVIVYWATLAIFEALGLETVLPPVLAAWAPNVLFGCAGLYLLLFVRT
ncbi:MAG TPA: LptF/LptG family permease [Candidatus Polarisedimenticolaceae bacterium]|nr:LptF/LptG family permease [Candidatus Polarisedimenticolaceae bacterium]